jgi:hypothetical protein
MISMLASSVVDLGFKLRSGRTEDYWIGIFCFSAKHSILLEGERAKTGWFGIGLMCPSGATCLSVNCCFSELLKYKCIYRYMYLKNCWVGIKQQSLTPYLWTSEETKCCILALSWDLHIVSAFQIAVFLCDFFLLEQKNENSFLYIVFFVSASKYYLRKKIAQPSLALSSEMIGPLSLSNKLAL